MVSRQEMADIARRYDTILSRAMCRALGVPMPEPRVGNVRAARQSQVYDGMPECFANGERVRM